MSGHSKWHSIKHKKGAADAARGKIFTRHANLITIASREGGGDQEMNPSLRLAIDNAKKENVPNENIERAIKRGTGDLKDASAIEEITYEGYGPNGIAIIVECLSDNKNRAYTNIKTAFSKNGGSLGETGSVTYMFDRKGVITVNLDEKNADEIELEAIDAGAQDTKTEDGMLEIYTSPSDLITVTEKLKASNIEIENAEIRMIPQVEIEISDEITAQKILNFLGAIEENPDVSNVHSNFNISNELMEKFT